MLGPARLTSGRGAQMESVCPKIIAHIGGCLLSAQFWALETGLPTPWAAPGKGEERHPVQEWLFRLDGRAPCSPPLGNDSTLKGINTGAGPYLGLTGLDRYQQCAEEEAGQEGR